MLDSDGNVSQTNLDKLDNIIKEKLSFLKNSIEKMNRTEAETEKFNANQLISEISKLCEKQQQTIHSLTESNNENKKTLESFLYTVSHDLKQPLITIHGFSSILKELLSDPETFEWINGILDATGKLNDMIDALLIISRIGRISASPEQINLKNLIEQIFLNFIASYQDIKVKLEVDESIPTLLAEKNWIETLFTQIISNSINFIGNTNSSPKIKFFVKDEDKSSLTIGIKDNGIGIESEFLTRVFDIFYVINPQQKRSGSCGAGLTIAKKIMNYLSGKIWIHSEIGNGTTVFLQFNKENTLKKKHDNSGY